MQNALIKYKRK